MVDSIGNGGFRPAGVDPARRAESTDRSGQGASFRDELEAQSSGDSGAVDSVALSPEALDVAQAQQAAADIRVAVEANPDARLGLDPHFDDAV